MKNSNLKTAAFSIIFLFFTLFSFAQEAQKTSNRLSNSLEEITITVKKSSLKDQAIFKNNKKALRRAAKLSKGDINKFKSEIATSIPSFSDVIDNNWEELYDESKLLTLIGKVESLPSVL
ncbi:hypothetical protein [Nonlabens sp. Asnod3-A02]|uniref:hypothetical protein n=1 Tax=Nonlabens sp. Asnod3-A02 TaxID=3160579 RepID=UPI00386B809A